MATSLTALTPLNAAAKHQALSVLSNTLTFDMADVSNVNAAVDAPVSQMADVEKSIEVVSAKRELAQYLLGIVAGGTAASINYDRHLADTGQQPRIFYKERAERVQAGNALPPVAPTGTGAANSGGYEYRLPPAAPSQPANGAVTVNGWEYSAEQVQAMQQQAQPTYAAPAPRYQQPTTYAAPAPTYTQPTTYAQPTYTQPTYPARTPSYAAPAQTFSQPIYHQPTYQPQPAPVYTQAPNITGTVTSMADANGVYNTPPAYGYRQPLGQPNYHQPAYQQPTAFPSYPKIDYQAPVSPSYYAQPTALPSFTAPAYNTTYAKPRGYSGPAQGVYNGPVVQALANGSFAVDGVAHTPQAGCTPDLSTLQINQSNGNVRYNCR